jgi:hypothetical protein
LSTASGSIPTQNRKRAFSNPFTTAIRATALPGWTHRDVDAILALVGAAGFTDVAAVPLEEIHRLAEHPPLERPS